MSLRFGSCPVVVGSSIDMAKFFLKTHDLAFLDRPAVAAARHILYNGSDVLWAPYGPYWRQGRKLYQNELLSAGRIKSTEHIRSEEVRCMLREMSAAASRDGGAVVRLKDHLSMASFNVVSRNALGRKYIFDGAGGVPVDDPGVLLPQRRGERRGRDPVAQLSGPAGVHQEDEEAEQNDRPVARARPGRAQ
jgi:hypothetical protein